MNSSDVTSATVSEVPSAVSPVNSSDEQPSEKPHMWNVRLLSLSFLLVQTAHLAACNLLSSLYAEGGLGTATLTLTSASLLLFNVLLPKSVFIWLSCTRSVLVCAVACTSLFFAANFNAKWYTLLPAAILTGLSISVIWNAISGYFGSTATHLAQRRNIPFQRIQSDLHCCLSACSRTAPIWGNLVAIGLLHSSPLHIIHQSLCDADSCQDVPVAENVSAPNFSVDHLYSGEDVDFRTLFAVFAGFPMAASLLLVIFLRTDGTLENPELLAEDMCPLGVLSEIPAFFRSPLKIQSAAWSILQGIREAFLVNDFTKNFITCPWGIHLIGDVMSCYGTISAFCPFFTSLIRTCCGQLAFFTLNYLVNMAAIFIMFIWQPATPQQLALYGILWGFASAFIHTIKTHTDYRTSPQSPEPPAVVQKWHLLGSCITLACSPFMCMTAKLCSQLIILNVISAIYLIAEVFCRNRESPVSSSLTEENQDNEINSHISTDNVVYI